MHERATSEQLLAGLRAARSDCFVSLSGAALSEADSPPPTHRAKEAER